jgi:TPP-dependent pyruvate/acetoin dehydrogenase alpha subunit
VDAARAGLLREGAVSEGEISGREEVIRREIEEAFAFAKEAPPPGADSYLDRVYASGESR